MSKPSDRQRAWAEMTRTAAAVCTVAITIYLLLERLEIIR